MNELKRCGGESTTKSAVADGYINHSRYRDSSVGIKVAVESHLIKFFSRYLMLGLGPSSKLELHVLLGPKVQYQGFFENMKKENE